MPDHKWIRPIFKIMYDSGTTTDSYSINCSTLCTNDFGDILTVKGEKPIANENGLLKKLKRFYSESKLTKGYYCMHDVPQWVLQLLEDSGCGFGIGDIIMSKSWLNRTIGKLDELRLHQCLQHYNSYCIYNFLKDEDVDKLTQIIFTRVRCMQSARKNVLFIEDGYKRDELRGLIKASRLLENQKNSFIVKHIRGNYGDKEVDLTLAGLVFYEDLGNFSEMSDTYAAPDIEEPI